MALFASRPFGRFGTLGLLYTAYKLWKRLSPQQKQSLKSHGSQLAGRLRKAQPPVEVQP